MRRHRNEAARMVEDRLSRLSGWLAARRRVGEADVEQLHARVESLRRELSRAREVAAEEAHEALARARAALEDMERDHEVPLSRASLRREELDVLKRHFRLTAALLPHLSNLDDPRWGRAREQYERSWEEVHRAFEAQGGTKAR